MIRYFLNFSILVPFVKSKFCIKFKHYLCYLHKFQTAVFVQNLTAIRLKADMPQQNVPMRIEGRWLIPAKQYNSFLAAMLMSYFVYFIIWLFQPIQLLKVVISKASEEKYRSKKWMSEESTPQYRWEDLSQFWSKSRFFPVYEKLISFLIFYVWIDCKHCKLYELGFRLSIPQVIQKTTRNIK